MSLQHVVIGIALLFVLILGMIFPRTGGTVVERVIEKTGEALGAVTGPDRYFDLFEENGVGMAYRQVKAVAAQDELCVMRAPTSATSTLVSAFIDSSAASTTATRLTIARGATAGATTTIIGTSYAIPSGVNFAVAASSSPASNPSSVIFAPGQYLTFALEGSLEAQWNVNAACSAIFQTGR